MAILKGWKKPDSPRGPISIDPNTRDIVQNVYMRRTELKDGKLVNTEFETIPDVKDPWKELNPPK
jgi:branched-chain amino acid transport system substrate-binding protein